jgi:hypothetical protein
MSGHPGSAQASPLGVRVDAALPAAQAAQLTLQVNTSAGGPVWRDVIQFTRDDDLACAHVLTAAPLLAAAAGPGAALRICTVGLSRRVLSTWHAGQGWRGALA